MGITARQFENLQRRVSRTRRAPTASDEATSLGLQTRTRTVILGIDPSLRGTGYGVIRTGRDTQDLLDQGTIRCPAAWARSRCLAHIAETLRQVIRAHPPAICVVEGLFYAQNVKTALIMGEARGAAIVAAAEAGLEICEIAPRKVKLAMIGYGAAQKLAVAKMVQRMLNLKEAPAPDAADALALALTHAQETGRHRLTPLNRI